LYSLLSSEYRSGIGDYKQRSQYAIALKEGFESLTDIPDGKELAAEAKKEEEAEREMLEDEAKEEEDID
jgi:hypothetical protein